MQRVKEILNNGELGAIKHAEVYLKASKGLIPEDDIRFDYSLGGGATMDMGCMWNSEVCIIQQLILSP
jgi:predicted dehydrogenase